MKCFLSLLVFLFLSSNESASQFVDDFSDGNLEEWQGDIDHFKINLDQQLQLNAPGGSTVSWLFTHPSYADSMSWEIYLKLDFAPSTSNQLRIYLGLTSDDYASASGYFLEIGTGGDQDAIELKYTDAGSSQIIGSSVPALVAAEPVELKIRITRSSGGLWECYSTKELVPELLFSTLHDQIPISACNTFGFYCKYSDTRRDKFFFDDISIDQLLADSTPPEWLETSVIDDHTLKLIFSEPLDVAVAMEEIHYELTPGNIALNTIEANGNEVVLEWSTTFISQEQYTLSISGLKDLAGNMMGDASKFFTYIQIEEASAYEILITEFMADPTPVNGLPDAEYIELFNNSDDIFELSNYSIRIGPSQRSLPDSLIFPGEYVLVVDKDNKEAFSSLAGVIAINDLPALTNNGTTIAMINSLDETLHSLSYTTDWYGDPTKSSGGWALEMINPSHICSEKDNWKASNDIEGGTPGRQNSLWMISPDLEGPELVSLFVKDDHSIEIRFNERLDSFFMVNEMIFPFEPAVDIAKPEMINSFTISLLLLNPLQENTTYRLLPFDAIDCLGNMKLTDTMVFGLVVSPGKGDILINEILFNPASGGSRYIELINASEKFFDLSNLRIGRLSENELYPTGINEIFGPGSIVAFTPDREDVLGRYHVPFPSKLYQMSLPSWDDEEDEVAILSDGTLIDSFTYSADWHHPVLSDQNGVSLERISTGSETSDRGTWHSASSLNGYGTPTGFNSQAIALIAPNTPFSITNKQFSPNDDGFKDFLYLQFEPEAGNDVGSIWVYDLEGREIQQILSNEILGATTLVQWNGRNSEGQLADMGIYLIYVELWDANGNVTHYQQSCALVKR